MAASETATDKSVEEEVPALAGTKRGRRRHVEPGMRRTPGRKARFGARSHKAGRFVSSLVRGPIEVHLVHLPDHRKELRFSVPPGYLEFDHYGNATGRLPFDATYKLKEWMAQPDNWVYPYPSDDAKRELADMCDMNLTQISNWFRNERKRVWLPLRKRAEDLWVAKGGALPRNGPVATGGPAVGGGGGRQRRGAIDDASRRARKSSPSAPAGSPDRSDDPSSEETAAPAPKRRARATTPRKSTPSKAATAAAAAAAAASPGKKKQSTPRKPRAAKAAEGTKARGRGKESASKKKEEGEEEGSTTPGGEAAAQAMVAMLDGRGVPDTMRLGPGGMDAASTTSMTPLGYGSAGGLYRTSPPGGVLAAAIAPAPPTAYAPSPLIPTDSVDSTSAPFGHFSAASPPMRGALARTGSDVRVRAASISSGPHVSPLGPAVGLSPSAGTQRSQLSPTGSTIRAKPRFGLADLALIAHLDAAREPPVHSSP